MVPDLKRQADTMVEGGHLHASALLLAAAPLVLLAACKAPPSERTHLPGADPDRGRRAMERAGCGACHAIPGIWPQGRTAAALERFADQSLIAGRLPNRPDILTRFIVNAPEVLPGSTMPAMPLSEEEARDAAAYLYSLGGR